MRTASEMVHCFANAPYNSDFALAEPRFSVMHPTTAGIQTNNVGGDIVVSNGSKAQFSHPRVVLMAMSPETEEVGGARPGIAYGTHETPFGTALLATTEQGICNLHFLNDPDEDNLEARLRAQWPDVPLSYEPEAMQRIGDRIFQSAPEPPQSLVLHVKGSDFQIQVWRALLQIPWGTTTTYQDLAQAIGRPTAARAIGNAVGRNPVGYIIPCHRVIQRSGQLGGYRWGLERKALMLEWEAQNAATPIPLSKLPPKLSVAARL